MATTTNYGWTTPDDTALVKDGAAAIRTLGSSIDTTTKNLNPSTTLGDLEYRSSTANTNTRIPIGTSGQGLQVVAGVPAWAASSTSTLTTTGDILYASAANTLARRAIGSTGDVLTVSGGLPTWAAPSAGGYTLLSTTSFASTTTISGISGSYTHLFMYIYGLTNASTNGSFQVSPNGATNLGHNFSSSSATAWATNTGQNIFPFGDIAMARANANNSLTLTFFNYANTSGMKPFLSFGNFTNGSGASSAGMSTGAYFSTSAITSLTFSNGGGALSTGTCLLYGVK